MKDRKGNDVKVGDRVYVLPRDGDDYGQGFVRAISTRDGRERARIDDGPADAMNILDERWNWSAWCGSAECEVLK